MHVRVHVIFNGTWHNQEVSRWRSIWSPEKNISGRTGGKLLLPEVDWKRANEADEGQRSSFWFVRYGYCLITAVSSQCRGEQELVQTTKNWTWQVYIKVTEWPYCWGNSTNRWFTMWSGFTRKYHVTCRTNADWDIIKPSSSFQPVLS